MHEKTFSVKTLGCKCNQYESAHIAEQFISRGYTSVSFGNPADIVIINTCTVTDKSNKKCRNYIRQGANHSRTGKVIVTGCMVNTHKHEIDSMPQVAASYTNEQKEHIFQCTDTIAHNEYDAALDTHVYPLPYLRTRGYVKIQDGCDGVCSYCIVPLVRGMPKSYAVHEIMDHIRRLIDADCPEIVFTGITIGKYQYGEYSLGKLIEKAVMLPGTFRVRVTSVEPTYVDDSLLAVLNHEKVCKHIHLPLQSGSDAVLTHMRRPYSAEYYLQLIEKIKSTVADIAIGTDIIVGYPIESDSDFAMTLQAVQQCEFAYIHQFTYSPRKGTISSALKNNPNSVVQKRADELRYAAQDWSLHYKKRFVNTIRNAVIEKGNDGISALTDNYIKVMIENDSASRDKTGTLQPVKILQADYNSITGVIVQD